MEIWRKLVYQQKFILFFEKISLSTWNQTEWETSIHIKYLVKLMKTWISRPFQPYASFPNEYNRVNFHNNNIFPTDLMLTGVDQEPAMLAEM